MIGMGYVNLRILLIEDEPYIRKLVAGLLKQLGVRHIFEAADGKDGFMSVVRVRPDVVLCDINMEPVDGFQFLANLRRTSVQVVAETPVIFLTADAAQESVARAAKLKVNGYITKPVSLTALRARLEPYAGDGGAAA